MDIKLLEKCIKVLKDNKHLPENFKTTLIAFKNNQIRFAAGNIGNTVIKWNAIGRAYESYGTNKCLILDEDEEIKICDALTFRRRKDLDFDESLTYL